MAKERDEFRLGPQPLRDAVVDLRDQLRDARRRPGRAAVLALGALALVGVLNAAWILGSARPRLARAEATAEAARQAESNANGQLALARLQNANLAEVVEYSTRYRIPADLAQAIHSIALSEDLDPEMAFRLVETESSFRRNALSEAGAVGYTQLLPSTARWLDPTTDDADLFERDVNLRLGFRYLRLLLEQSGGDMRLALLAYNRGPATVRTIVANGGDPANGYASRIMGGE
jgi:soluble lytic murein transglycosylase-like protein